MKTLRLLVFSVSILFLFTGSTLPSSNKTKMDEYSIDDIYQKIDLDYGTLDEQGQSIDCIFTKSSLKAGRYEITISDGPGDLYEINGTDYYLTFTSYYGYAGYGDEGIIEINAYGSGSFYKYDD
ncbi:hypothetical protein GQR60_14595 [Labilibaculum sp. A4]|uniref:hypothetical protein n=1 Tax=Labilibaculum euxinus TaxID=2686357 RepID=UPI000F626D1D|nr:hypothetical protein [Labilibaculum euxinus]MDQ1770220.1 hypothetical protein [Labilibaculum euxinus]MWN77566.1 hypothetical protein [Labilibaculum euxinus]